MPAIIQLNTLSKHFKVPVRESGLKASIQSLMKRLGLRNYSGASA